MPSTFRPVSLISIPCKILEHLVRDIIMKYLNLNGLLTNCQHGFVGEMLCYIIVGCTVPLD